MHMTSQQQVIPFYCKHSKSKTSGNLAFLLARYTLFLQFQNNMNQTAHFSGKGNYTRLDMSVASGEFSEFLIFRLATTAVL